jgi:hypothetical protein
LHNCARGEQCLVDAAWAKDVEDTFPRVNQIVGNYSPVAPPQHRLCAHDCGTLLAPQSAKFGYPFSKFARQGVVSVIAKTQVFPEQIRRGAGFGRILSQASK